MLFLFLAVAALVLLAALAGWYLGSYQSGGGTVSGIMGQMMGNQSAGGMTTPMPGYVWGSLLLLLALVGVGIAGVAYYTAVPPIRTVAAVPETAAPEPTSPAATREDWNVLLRTSKPEEKKVLEVLAAHNGRYLQKFIVKEAGLSRLKTHRIISRLVERGVVTAVPSGNTNEISLAPWLRQKPAVS